MARTVGAWSPQGCHAGESPGLQLRLSHSGPLGNSPGLRPRARHLKESVRWKVFYLPLHTPASDDGPTPTSQHQGRRGSGKGVKRNRVKGIGPGHSLPPATWLLTARSLQRKPHLSDSYGLERSRKRQEDVTGGSRLGAKTKEAGGRAGSDEGEVDRSTKNAGAMGGDGLLWSPAVSSKGVKPEEKGSRACGVAMGPPPGGGLHSPWRDLLHPDMMCFTKAGKEDRKQPCHLAPLNPLNPSSLVYTT